LREHVDAALHHDKIGFNYRMEGIQGAVLGVKLKHRIVDGRTPARGAPLSSVTRGWPFTLPLEASYAASAYHLYAVRHPQRDQLKAHLEARPIGCALHYPFAVAPAEMLCVASGIRLVIFRSPKPPLESA